jgi:hypothetical protein
VGSVISITKAELEVICKPNVTFSNSGSNPALSIGATAAGFRWRFGRFSGFNGVGERAINVDASVPNVMLRDIRFFDNTDDITDNGNASLSTSGLLTE